MSDYDAALLNYNRSLEIYLTQGTQINSQLIYGIVATIVHIYIHYKHDYDLGLKYGLIRHEHTLKYDALCPQYDTDAKKWGKKGAIADICMNIHRYDLAIEISYQKNLKKSRKIQF